MASTKKTTRAASSTRKKTTARATKPAAKRAPAKSRSATSVRRTKAAAPRSFKRSKPQQPFMSLNITVQTFYWLILAILVIGLALWVVTLHNQVQDVYDEVNRSHLYEAPQYVEDL